MFDFDKDKNIAYLNGYYYWFYADKGVYKNSPESKELLQTYSDGYGNIKRVHFGCHTIIRIYDDKLYIAGKGVFHKMKNDIIKKGILYACNDGYFTQYAVIKNNEKYFCIDMVADTKVTELKKELFGKDKDNLMIELGFIYTFKDGNQSFYRNYAYKLRCINSFQLDNGDTAYIYKNEKYHESAILKSIIIDNGHSFVIVDYTVSEFFFIKTWYFSNIIKKKSVK